VGSGFLVLLVAMFGFLYFLLIRPQRSQQRKHSELLASLKPGDEVVTAGGIYGEVVQLDAERVMLEIDEDVRIAVARRAIATVVPPEELERLEAEEVAGAAEPVDEAESAEPVTADEPLTAEERDTARS
jgi:preprotein translocase subunit YajC